MVGILYKAMHSLLPDKSQYYLDGYVLGTIGINTSKFCSMVYTVEPLLHVSATLGEMVSGRLKEVGRLKGFVRNYHKTFYEKLRYFSAKRYKK